ncbi:type II toxin-antitoxin system PemK/MazF family toxin [Acidobacteria bacterium ACD]|nr:MAG: type II toxin-antitoxin system PemK/MazF family toxin [Acidobacteriota bacterium]MCE7958305.1 type II toxin-antitoxin system PemK/MazF family toxin [Acidobacteria bacterium ACB2]MDL1951650.1 type II toxin-antitoxin system PemK/MazF family toxin [Acidobacteria bacterium ACD]
MKRGELYLVQHPGSRDPRRQRVFVIVSRQLLLDSAFSTAICAPVYTRRDGLHTQVDVGVDEGLKHDSSVHRDELMSLPKAVLTNYVGSLSPAKLAALDRALAFAVGLTADPEGGPS